VSSIFLSKHFYALNRAPRTAVTGEAKRYFNEIVTLGAYAYVKSAGD